MSLFKKSTKTRKDFCIEHQVGGNVSGVFSKKAKMVTIHGLHSRRRVAVIKKQLSFFEISKDIR